MKRLFCILLCAALLLTLGACKKTDTTAPENSGAANLPKAQKTEKNLEQIRALGTSPDDNYRVWYEIFVYSFCDSDGDGIGDIQGVISKLPYLQELGVNGIWLMPVHPSTTYHKYNVSDYCAIDPDYGTLEDFQALLTQCDSLGIKVIMDLVVNHTGSEHPWFKEAVSYLQALPEGQQPDPAVCPYVDYYYFGESSTQVSAAKQVPNSRFWYEAQFSYDMPDLNLANPALRKDIEDIMAFWLGKGVDGFRLDAAKEFYTGRTDLNVEVLSWLQTAATALKPDAYMVAEVWEPSYVAAQYYESGITSIFNFSYGNSDGRITKILRAKGDAKTVSGFATSLESTDAAFLAANPNYIDAPFLSNHDVGRILGFANRDPARVKMGAAMNLMMSGSAFIYYGEEIGMAGSGNDPSKRVAMYWNDSGEGMPQLPPEASPQSHDLGSLESQRHDDGSVYNYYRQLIALRQALPVISHGRTTAETALNANCISALRKSWNGQECIILMNISPEAAAVDLSGYTDWQLAAALPAGEEDVTLSGTDLQMPAYALAVLLPAN